MILWASHHTPMSYVTFTDRTIHNLRLEQNPYLCVFLFSKKIISSSLIGWQWKLHSIIITFTLISNESWFVIFQLRTMNFGFTHRPKVRRFVTALRFRPNKSLLDINKNIMSEHDWIRNRKMNRGRFVQRKTTISFSVWKFVFLTYL